MILLRSSSASRFGWGVVLVMLCSGGLWFFTGPRQAECQRAKSDYVGVQRCRGCHQAEFKTWAGSAHAKAFASLPEKERSNPLCIRCHSTGTSDHLQGVQCESCHGPGRYYSSPEVMLDVELSKAVGLKVSRGASGCLSCHNTSPKLRKFHFKKMWKKIAHGKKATR